MRQRAQSADERLRSLLELQSLLARVSREIGPALELRPVLVTILGAMRSLVEFRGGTIGLVDERGVYVAANDPPVSPDVMAARVPVGTGLAGRVVSTGRPIYSPDIRDDARVNQELARLGSNAIMRSYLGVPLICLGKVIGVLQVDSTEPDAFDADDLHVLAGLAAQVAGAIESARHHEKMAELESLKSDFIARVSHELKTPLTILSGFTRTLAARSDNLSDDQRTWVDRIDLAAKRLETLIDELLTATGFEAGMMVPHPEVVELAAVLEQVQAHAVEPERVSVSCDPSVRVTVDPKVVAHALGLLVDNALKYAGDAVLTAEGDSRGWRVTVVDHGPGIPSHLRARIFERFTRGDHTKPGMGLGLSVVQNLAGAIGATVALDEAPGGGARFTLQART